ncbi:MAG: SPOR domain-containing protein [Paludibacter sp.]
MTRTIRILFFAALIGTTFSACKTKQKVTKIPGANVEATAPVTNTTPAVKPQQPTPVPTGAEQTRNEKFSLADGETNADALKYKYHVVVGSFKSQVNAKGLQSTLKGEGNTALVVVNEQGMFRVLIASFNEYAQARARINQISQRFPDAWVLVQK